MLARRLAVRTALVLDVKAQRRRRRLAAAQDNTLLGFYDTWVARDTNGSLFLKQAPFVAEPAAQRRIARGLPFPVGCCWNGLVVLNAAPFLRHGTRVRCARGGAACGMQAHSQHAAALAVAVKGTQR